MSGGDRRGAVHPVQVIGVVISLIFIIAMLFIASKYFVPLIFGPKDGDGSQPDGTSQSQSQGDDSSSQQPPDSSADQSGGDSSATGGESEPPGSNSGPETPPPAGAVTSIALSRTDFTLAAEETYHLIATPAPTGTSVALVWTSSNEEVLTVDENGIVKNINNGTGVIKATITVTGGGKSAECIVYCKPSGGAIGDPVAPPVTGNNTGNNTGGNTGGGSVGSSTGTIAPNTRAVIVNAENGLNIRSGPGSSHEKVASAENGAEVTVLEDARNGWYKVDYGAGKIGYVSGDFIAVKK